jgi:hypothetical protein
LQKKAKEFLNDKMYQDLSDKPIANVGSWKD